MLFIANEDGVFPYSKSLWGARNEFLKTWWVFEAPNKVKAEKIINKALSLDNIMSGNAHTRDLWEIAREKYNLSQLEWYLACGKKKKVRENSNIFLRFGSPRPDCISINHVDGRAEKGLSVFELEQIEPKKYKLSSFEYSGIAEGSLIHFITSGVQPYAVSGKVIGRGSDGEPLLSKVRYLGKFNVVSEEGEIFFVLNLIRLRYVFER